MSGGLTGGINRVRWRSRAFWAELGISLTSKERDIFAVRNTIVHEGNIGDDATPQAVEKNFRRARALANFFNRAMLTVLGRPGRYLDAAKDRRTS